MLLPSLSIILPLTRVDRAYVDVLSSRIPLRRYLKMFWTATATAIVLIFTAVILSMLYETYLHAVLPIYQFAILILFVLGGTFASICIMLYSSCRCFNIGLKYGTLRYILYVLYTLGRTDRESVNKIAEVYFNSYISLNKARHIIREVEKSTPLYQKWLIMAKFGVVLALSAFLGIIILPTLVSSELYNIYGYAMSAVLLIYIIWLLNNKTAKTLSKLLSLAVAYPYLKALNLLDDPNIATAFNKMLEEVCKTAKIEKSKLQEKLEQIYKLASGKSS